MKIYDPGEVCSKCGGRVLKIEYQGEVLLKAQYRMAGELLPHGLTEQLQLTCQTCLYRFYRAPLDTIKVI